MYFLRSRIDPRSRNDVARERIPHRVVGTGDASRGVRIEDHRGKAREIALFESGQRNSDVGEGSGAFHGGVLHVEKEECLVLPDWPSDGSAELVLPQIRNGMCEEVARVQRVVAPELEQSAVKIIGP